MNKKEEYKNSLRSHYPDEPDNVLELIWYFSQRGESEKIHKTAGNLQP